MKIYHLKLTHQTSHESQETMHFSTQNTHRFSIETERKEPILQNTSKSIISPKHPKDAIFKNSRIQKRKNVKHPLILFQLTQQRLCSPLSNLQR